MLPEETEVVETETDPSSPPESSPPPTPIIETPEKPPTDSIDVLTKRALQEQGNEIAALKAENEQLKAVPVSAPAPVDKAKEQERFFENPGDYMRGLIRDELKSQVEPLLKPLNEYAESARTESAHDKLFASAAADPILGPILAKVRPAVEDMMRNAEPTAINMQQAIYTANGLLAAGRLPANLMAAEAALKPETPNMSIPPQVPPSPPPAPINAPRPAGLRKLTEAERAIAKAFGRTEAEYLAYLEAPSDIEGMRVHVDTALGGK